MGLGSWKNCLSFSKRHNLHEFVWFLRHTNTALGHNGAVTSKKISAQVKYLLKYHTPLNYQNNLVINFLISILIRIDWTLTKRYCSNAHVHVCRWGIVANSVNNSILKECYLISRTLFVSRVGFLIPEPLTCGCQPMSIYSNNLR
jgi:hypothetical protein